MIKNKYRKREGAANSVYPAGPIRKPRIILTGAPEWFRNCLEYDLSKVEVLYMDSLTEDSELPGKRRLQQFETTVNSDLLVVFPDPAAYGIKKPFYERQKGAFNAGEQGKEENSADYAAAEHECLKGIWEKCRPDRFGERHSEEILNQSESISYFHPRRMVLFEPFPSVPEMAVKGIKLEPFFGFGDKIEPCSRLLSGKQEGIQIPVPRYSLPSASKLKAELRTEIHRAEYFSKDQDTEKVRENLKKNHASTLLQPMSQYCSFFQMVEESCTSYIMPPARAIHEIEIPRLPNSFKSRQKKGSGSEQEAVSWHLIEGLPGLWDRVIDAPPSCYKPGHNFWQSVCRWSCVSGFPGTVGYESTLGYFLTSVSGMLETALLAWPRSAEAVCEKLENIFKFYNIEISPANRYRQMLKRFEGVSVQGNKSVYLGKSKPLYGYYKSILQAAADTESHVLITGESGTGKEHTAALIHQFSERGRKDLRIVNCASFQVDTAYSEIFGHVEGAYTGAVESRKGAILDAEGSTLFLDEVHHLPLDSCAHLLRFLQENTVRPLGGDRDSEKKCDTRIIAATNNLDYVRKPPLRDMGFIQRFKRQVNLPGLNERIEELEYLAKHFLEQEVKKNGSVTESTDELLRNLPLQQWKYRDWTDLNIRELENEILKIVMDLNIGRWLGEKPEQSKQEPGEKGKSDKKQAADKDRELLEILKEVSDSKGSEEDSEKIIQRISKKAGDKYKTRDALRNRLKRIKSQSIQDEAYKIFKNLFPDRRGRGTTDKNY